METERKSFESSEDEKREMGRMAICFRLGLSDRGETSIGDTEQLSLFFTEVC